MKVIPPGLDFSSLKVAIPEDPTLKEFEQARAAQDLLERPQALSPATSPRQGGCAAAGATPVSPGGTAASGAGPAVPAPPTPSLTGVASPGGQSPKGGASGTSEGGAAAFVPPPRPAELILDPSSGPPIWNVSGKHRQHSTAGTSSL